MSVDMYIYIYRYVGAFLYLSICLLVYIIVCGNEKNYMNLYRNKYIHTYIYICIYVKCVSMHKHIYVYVCVV